jgi:small subunit ribosomal protein S8
MAHTGHFKSKACGIEGSLGISCRGLLKKYSFPYPLPNAGFATGASTKGFRSNDNLSDLLSRIRNGYFRSFEDITVIDCKQTRELLDSFIYAGYIHSWKPLVSEQTKFVWKIVPSDTDTKNTYLQVNLKYFKNIPAIRGLQQVSRPGNRTYISIKRILKYSEEQNWGETKTLFLSTPEGILNHREIIINHDTNEPLKRGGHSGEALCLIW